MSLNIFFNLPTFPYIYSEFAKMITRSLSKSITQKPVNQLLLQVPLKNTGLMEDHIFKDDFMIQNQSDMQIEGLPYTQIQKDSKKSEYLEKLRRNMPGYWRKTGHEKYHYFNKINKEYEEQNAQNNESTPKKKKSVSFCQHENFKIFDKKQTPNKVSISLEKSDPLKQ